MLKHNNDKKVYRFNFFRVHTEGIAILYKAFYGSSLMINLAKQSSVYARSKQ